MLKSQKKVVNFDGSVNRPEPSAPFITDDASVFEGNVTKISLFPVPGNIRE
jgi:hypothetical protein